MLTSAQIAGMRATAERALPETCVVQRKTAVSDGGGGTTESWASHVTDVPCRIAPLGGGETGTAGSRVIDETTHVVTLPAGEDITEADRVVVDARTYEVTVVRDRGEWELSRRVEVKEVP